MEKLYPWIVAAVAIACVSFIAGVDDGLNSVQRLTKAERLHIYCNTPGHIETYCYKPKEIAHD